MVSYTSTATIILLSLLSTSSTISATTTTNNNGGAKFNLRKRIIGRPINTVNNNHKLSRRQQHDDTTTTADAAAAIEQEQYHRTLQLQENSMSMPPLQQSQLVIDGSPKGEPTVGPPANLTQIEQAAWWDSFLGGNSGVAGTPYPTYYPTYNSPSTPPVSSAPVTSAPITSTPTSSPITSAPITPYPTYSPTIDPPLITKANNLGSIFGPGMYTECQGDCDTHTDCLGDNYMCFYRDDNELVPGCDNDNAVRGVDYCVERTNEILQEVESDLVGEGGYGRCEGNCNSDLDCQGELLCQERNGWDLIYGCVGWGEEDVNYCREKTDDEKVGQLLVTDVYSGIIMNSNEVVETEPVAGATAPSTEVSSPVDKRTPKVIKLLDDTSSYFVGYNGQQVTITKIDKETDEISLDGVVLNGDDTHVISNWKNSGTDLVISASEMTDGYASIDIQLAEPESPSSSPEASPTGGPSTLTPSGGPSTLSPTKVPTTTPTATPSLSPSSSPTKEPSSSPTESPSFSPTKNPTASPTLACGNTICELELSEDPNTCPTDCIFRNYITRNYERNEKSNGHMFTVSASDKVTIGYLGIVAEKDGNSDIQVYTKSGSHTGFETAWTLVFDNTVSVIKERFTSLKLDSEITIEEGSSQAFYIFSKVGLLYHKVGKRRELEKGLTLTFDADEDTEEVEPTIAEAKNDKNQGDVVPAVVTTVGDSTITISQMVSTKKLFKDVQNVVAVYTGGISYYMSARDVA